MSESELLRRAAELAIRYRESLPERPVHATATIEELRGALGGPLPLRGNAAEAIERLAAGAERGLIANAGPRFFGFVIGASLPVAVAADWLASAWNQNGGLYAASPANSVAEEVAAGWLLDLFGLPATSSVGFVTGGQMANFTALATARHALLERSGWDVETRGLFGAPEIDVVLSEESHVTILTSLQMLGMGRERVRRVAADGEGRMRADALQAALANARGPLLVCAQAGNVNTGSFDPFAEIVPLVRERGGWLHVDGAFGLWAAASPALAHLLRGFEGADSWSSDAHKWLNVPYDCGIAISAHPEAHRAAMTTQAAYLVQTAGSERDPLDWVPEFSRRGRGFAVWAALASLGRSGVAELVEQGCRNARRMAERLRDAPGASILNDVVLNQVLVRFEDPARGGDAAAADAFTQEVIHRVQEDGTCWLAGTTWHGVVAMRVSICGAGTTQADIDRSADAILRAARLS